MTNDEAPRRPKITRRRYARGEERPFFKEASAARQALLWSIATRRQLDRWADVVDQIVESMQLGEDIDGRLVWKAEAERHLALVAAGNVATALKLPTNTATPTDADLIPTLEALRNVSEHWDQQMPYFNVQPHEGEAHLSGRVLVGQDPQRTPFAQFARYGSDDLLWADVPASRVRAMLDDIERQIIEQHPTLADYLSPSD